MKINSNLASGNAQKNLNRVDGGLKKSMERLSSAKRINSAADDAAGMAIAARMATLILGGNVGIRNANDGISMVQTAEGALQQSSDDLQRMRELAVQAANGTLSGGDRKALEAEFNQLQASVGDTIENAEFNGNKLLSEGGSVDFQVGPNADAATNRLSVTTENLAGNPAVSEALSLSIGDQAAASDALTKIDAAIEQVAGQRAEFGAAQSRLESAVRNGEVSGINHSAARSRIEDADYAKTTSELTRSLILEKGGIATLAQANAASSLALGLLGKEV